MLVGICVINAMWNIDFPLPSESPSTRRLKVAFYLRLRAAAVVKVEKHWPCEDLHQTLGLLHHSHPSCFLQRTLREPQDCSSTLHLISPSIFTLIRDPDATVYPVLSSHTCPTHRIPRRLRRVHDPAPGNPHRSLAGVRFQAKYARPEKYMVGRDMLANDPRGG